MFKTQAYKKFFCKSEYQIHLVFWKTFKESNEKETKDPLLDNLPTQQHQDSSSDHDPFSASPFKLLFSTFGGGEGRNGSNVDPNTSSENLSTTLDPDEFLQKHFK